MFTIYLLMRLSCQKLVLLVLLNGCPRNGNLFLIDTRGGLTVE